MFRSIVKKPLLLFILSSIFLVGCTGSRLNVKKALANHEKSVPDTWTSVQDTLEMPVSEHLLDLIDDDGLRSLISKTFEYNHDLRASARRLAASKLLQTETRSPRYPGVSASYQATQHNQGVDIWGDKKIEKVQKLSVAASWEIDTWQKLADMDRANLALTFSQVSEFAAVRDALGARVIQTWIGLVSLKQAIGVEQSRVSILQQLQNVIRRRYLTGIGSLDDLAAAKSNTEQTKAFIEQQKSEYNTMLRSLEVLLGQTPQATLMTSDSLPQIEPVFVSAPRIALIKRPDVESALWRLKASDATASATAKELLPSFSLTGETSWEKKRFLDVIGARTPWSIVGSITQPLFQRGLLKSRADAKRMELEAAWEDFQSIVLTAISEVENGLGNEESLIVQRNHIKLAIAESQRNTQIFERKYRAGLANILELLQAQNQEADLRRKAIEINGQILSNRVDLAIAAGAGFEETEE